MAQEPDSSAVLLTRGEAVKAVVSSFELEKRNADYISGCLGSPDECFFVFSAMSDYDDIRFDPLILYPDVFPANRYYNAINTATIFGLVHGYLDEESSPFHPNDRITRIQALKVVLGAAGMVVWQDKFELAADFLAVAAQTMPFMDVFPERADMWWYSRYIGKACDADIIDCSEGGSFRPDDAITKAELDELISKTIDFSTGSNETRS